MLAAFRIVYWLAAALFFFAAVLVTASLFAAEPAPQSATAYHVSYAVSVLFAAIGLLMMGIQSRVVSLAGSASDNGDECRTSFRSHWGVLLIYLTIGGTALDLFMIAVLSAILARMNEGYAVFG